MGLCIGLEYREGKRERERERERERWREREAETQTDSRISSLLSDIDTVAVIDIVPVPNITGKL